jgi:glycine cleavage system H lipoate-binding protein
MDGFKYAKSHEYVNMDGDVATIGISDFAQVRHDLPFLTVQSVTVGTSLSTTLLVVCLLHSFLYGSVFIISMYVCVE